jgi:hypothetical protein
MASEVTVAAIGVVGAVLGSAVSGILYYQINEKRLKQETKQKRAEVYLEKKVEYLTEVNEKIHDMMNLLARLQTVATEVEIVYQRLENNETRDELFVEKYEKYLEVEEEAQKASEEFLRTYILVSGFLSEDDKRIFHLASDLNQAYMAETKKEISGVIDDLKDESLRRQAKMDIKQETEDELDEKELKALTNFYARRYSKEADDEREHFDKLAQGLREELQGHEMEMLQQEVDGRKELEDMASATFELCLDIIQEELAEPVDELTTKD